MTWNHRVICHNENPKEPWYAIHEVFYDDDGNPESCTKEPIQIIQEDVGAIKWEVDKIRKALEKPVLDYEMFTAMEKKLDSECSPGE